MLPCEIRGVLNGMNVGQRVGSESEEVTLEHVRVSKSEVKLEASRSEGEGGLWGPNHRSD